MKLRWLAATTVAAVIALAGSLAFSDDDRKGEKDALFAGPHGIRAVDNPLYAAECGSCHFAYQPGLLPARSWQKLMSGLDEHFGENAELTPEVRTLITEYLVQNAAEQDGGKIARGILRTVDAQATPERITDTGYFARKHDEIPPRLWRDNPKVGSLSQCSACHTKADNANFDEHHVLIPGYGRWED